MASAPLRGRHINLSPKGLPDSCLAILDPNQVAYIDSTGSGCETISHLRENGRVTLMFCSFDASPRIMRLFCTGSVIEWDQPEFPAYLKRMGKSEVAGARAVIKLDVFKVRIPLEVKSDLSNVLTIDLGANILRLWCPVASLGHRLRIRRIQTISKGP